MIKNYIIEGNDTIDFFAAIQENTKCEIDNTKNQVCLLTGEPLEYNHIQLTCNHAFNYEPLFKEILHQKTLASSRRSDNITLQINQIKCPYCRTVNNKLLPYIPLNGYKSYIKGVNSPLGFTMEGHSCEWTFKTGKKKGCLCGRAAFQHSNGAHCPLHAKLCKEPVKKDLFKPMTTEDLNKLTVVQLKELLREIKLPVSGKKSILIERINEYVL